MGVNGAQTELSEEKLKSIQESTKKIVILSKKNYSGKIILGCENGLIKNIEYKIFENIK
jgi:hypothetical protein